MSEAEQVLNTILARVATEQGYNSCQISTKQLSSGGANYTSFIYQASISAPNKEDLKLFVKVAAAGEQMRSIAPFRMFDIESFAYNHLLKTYKKLEDKHNVPKEHRLITPKFYAESKEYLREALVLEDLTTSGYITYDRFKSVDWEYASISIQSLAKLHALSIAWSVEDPEEFEKTDTVIRMSDTMDGITAYLDTVLSNALEVTRDENKERVSKFVEKIKDREFFVQCYKPMRRPVIGHGDYRASNLMHKVNKDGSVHVIPVDYQTLQRGNPILDLMYFIYNGSDKNFRDEHLKNLLELYYSEICACLQRLHLNADKLYPREDFDYELQKVLPFGLATAIFCLLLVTADEQDAPTVNKDISITDFAITPSTLYKERLNDIIDDYIEMGVI